MSIEFICPATGVATNFPDAYAGVKYRCKHCAEFHTLPNSENYVHKDILSACPKNDEVVSIDSSIKTNRFKCASCGEIHEIPGETIVGATEIASSTKYQNQSRQKIIPSVRKRSGLLGDSDTKMKAVSPSDLKNLNQSDRKPSPQTEQKPTNQTERKVINQTGNKEQLLSKTDKPRKSNLPPKKSYFFTNLFIIIFFIGLAYGVWYFFIVSGKNSTNVFDLNNKILMAQKEISLGNFEKAISLTDQVIDTAKNNPKLKIKINFKEVETNNQLYKKQKEIYLVIENDFSKDINNPTINRIGVEKSLARLNEKSLKLSDDLITNTPILKAMETIKASLLKKYAVLTKQNLDKKFTLAEEFYQDGHFQETFLKIREINSIIEGQSKEDQIFFKSEFSKKLKKFEDVQTNYENINNLITKATETPNSINDAETALKSLANNAGINDVTLKNHIEQKLNQLGELKRILEVKKIDSQLKDKPEIKKELIAYLNKLSTNDTVVRKEVIKHISRVSNQIRELPDFLVTPLENLKATATAIGEVLNNNNDVLKIKIDTEKSKITLQDENINYTAGYLEIEGKKHFVLIVNGIRMAYESSLFEKNKKYFIKHAQNLHDVLILNGGEIVNANANPWVINEDIFRIGATAAFSKTDKGDLLFLIDQIYTLTTNKPFVENEAELIAALQSQIEKTKKSLINSSEPLEVKSNLNYLLNKICPSENQKINQLSENTDWLVNGLYQSLLSNDTCLKAFNELKTFWVQKLEKSSLWLEGESLNKTTFQLNRLNTNRVFGKIYNPEKVETSFITSTAEPIDLLTNDISLQYCFLKVYQGNHPAEPNQNLTRIFTIHPTMGIVSTYDNISGKLEFNKQIWESAFEYSRLFGANGTTKINLPPHTLNIDAQGNLKAIYTNSFQFNAEKIQSGSDDSFEKWAKENSKNLGNLGNLNLVLLFTSEYPTDSLQYKNLFETPINPEKPVLIYKNNKLQGNAFAIPLFINSIISGKGQINIIASINNEFRNIWQEDRLDKQNLFYLNQGLIHRLETDDFLKDIKVCFQNKNNIYFNPYKITVANLDSKNKSFSFTNVPSLLISNFLPEENQVECLEKFISGSHSKYIELINSPSNKSVKGSELMLYPLWESQKNFKMANDDFSNGVKNIRKDNTLSANIEHASLIKNLNNTKEIETTYMDLFQSIVESDVYKKDPAKLTDIRFYLAKELAELGKTNQATTFLNPTKSTNNLSFEEAQIYAEICFLTFILLDKNIITPTEYKNEMQPIQTLLDVSLQSIFNESSLDINSLLKLNLAWVKFQSSNNGADKTNQQLLAAPTLEAKLLPISGPELVKQQWEWAKQNPLCFELMIQSILNDIEPDKEVEAKQKINISLKLIKAMTRNLAAEPTAWRKNPCQTEINILTMFEDLNESKWDSASEKIKKIVTSNKPETRLYRYLCLAMISVGPSDFNSFLDSNLKFDLPDDFYRKFYFNLQLLKFSKKAKLLSSFVKDRYSQRTDLILDISKD